MTNGSRVLIGRGRLDDGVARAWRTETRNEQQVLSDRLDHPADYEADPGLVNAMNVALLLGRPLLLTGRPGTGKSQFADRVAWEFNLAPVLRFEAQSVSEAQDLFYRFDTIGRLAAAHDPGRAAAAEPRDYISLAALGKAVLYSRPDGSFGPGGPALSPPHPAPVTGRASVVLIDEIDKASRDFPNDLLNAIERLAFEVPELGGRRFDAARDPATRPIVIITSNSERELPEPFLRRCVYYDIPDPKADTLKTIVCNRVLSRLGTDGDGGSGARIDIAGMPPLFRDLVDCFVSYREQGARKLSFMPGTSELIDLVRWVANDRETQPGQPLASATNVASAQRAAAAVAKGRGDQDVFLRHLTAWRAGK